MIEITSAENQIIKHIRKLSTHSYRETCKETLLEGERSVNDCVKYGGKIKTVLIREDYTGRTPECERLYKTSPKLFDSLAETKTPQGILATAEIKVQTVQEFKQDGLVLVCDRIQDPGNLGTIFRTAHAVCANGVILIKGCADPFSSKTVRASMGSVFAVPIALVENMPKMDGYIAFCGTLSPKSESLYETAFPEKSMLVLGNEANGASAEIIEACQKHILIPMPGGAESLNVATAGAIMMYEYYRQVQYVR